MKTLWCLLLGFSVVLAKESPPSESSTEIVISASELPQETVFSDNTLSALKQNIELSTEDLIDVPSGDTSFTSSLPSEPPTIAQQNESYLGEDLFTSAIEEKEAIEDIKSMTTVIDFGQVFKGSPTIYSILLMLSIASVAIFLYVLLSLRKPELLPQQHLKLLKDQLQTGSYELALKTCQKHHTPLFGMVTVALKNRSHSPSLTPLETMQTEGRRITAAYWQKIGLLSEIAIIAPMLGLLGTVLGMFYAFYDLNQSADTISALFDGLGISVGTTIGGLIVAIVAILFHSMTKYRLIQQLATLENEAKQLAQWIDTKRDL